VEVIDRASAADLTQLAAEIGTVPMQVGGVVVLEPSPDLTPQHLAGLVGSRAAAIRRLRQRLVKAPFGCGRAYWADDPSFDVDHHVEVVRCPAPADQQTLLDLAADLLTTPLPRDRPLWRSCVVTGLTDGSNAVAVVLHHVLADGIGGLAVLGSLVDGAPAASETDVRVRRPPERRALAREAWATRLAAVRRVPQSVRTFRQGLHELGGGLPKQVGPSSLLQPTSARRHVNVVRADLESVRGFAHCHQVSVNDVLVAVLAAGMARLLESRGERVTELVVSVPISSRKQADTAGLGNAVGTMPVKVPVALRLADCAASVADTTRAIKASGRGTSAALLDPVFRALASMHLLGAVISRQRLVHSFISNMRGPEQVLRLGGAAVTELVPLAATPGNVTVCFTVLSYSGSLNIAVVTDPERVPDVAVLTDAICVELARIATARRSRGEGTGAPPSSGFRPTPLAGSQ
jgi:WS/DGAT/MGAT family acyltransferase